jgi:hypothetical protein
MRVEARSWLFASLAVVTALLGGGCAQGGDEPNPASAGSPLSGRLELRRHARPRAEDFDLLQPPAPLSAAEGSGRSP